MKNKILGLILIGLSGLCLAGSRHDTITVLTKSTTFTKISYYYGCDIFTEVTDIAQKTVAECVSVDSTTRIMGKTISKIESDLSIIVDKRIIYDAYSCRLVSMLSDSENTSYIFDCRY